MALHPSSSPTRLPRWGPRGRAALLLPRILPGILGRRALPAGRIAVLGATMDLHHGLLRLPAASERSINLHEGQQLAELGLGDAELRREHPGVAVQHFEIARRTTPISDVGQTPRVRGRLVQHRLLLPEVAALAIADES